jgi:hypothetical protein
LSCLVLSCLVCLVLSCLVLYCLVLSCLVLSCLVLSCVLSCGIFCFRQRMGKLPLHQQREWSWPSVWQRVRQQGNWPCVWYSFFFALPVLTLPRLVFSLSLSLVIVLSCECLVFGMFRVCSGEDVLFLSVPNTGSSSCSQEAPHEKGPG